ncbi:MAG: hypothetical protein U5N85_20155, partial [Arcicella sp.]|nr:hypothetical protein [Arcicella sp.]
CTRSSCVLSYYEYLRRDARSNLFQLKTTSLTVGTGCISVITSITSGNWEDTSTWNFNRIPSVADIVIINDKRNVLN